MTSDALATVKPESAEMSREELAALYGAAWENVDHKAEITIARLGVVQPGTPEIGAQVKGYEAGQIIDTMTREVLSSKIIPPWLVDKGVPANELSLVHCLPVLVVFKLPTEFARWTTNDERKKDPSLKKLLWKTIDQNDPRVRENIWKSRGGTWGTPSRPETHGQKPPVTDCINFLVQPLKPDYTPRCAFRVAPFSRTSAFCGKMVAGYMNEKRMVFQPFWSEVIWLYTDKDKHEDSNSFYYFYKMAIGRPLIEVNPDIALQCVKMARQCMDKETGHALQCELLKLAAEDEGQADVPNNEHAPRGTESTVTVDAAAATADPFDGK